MNILEDTLDPKTPGEYIDALIISNIRMWHEQEVVYEIDTLKNLTLEKMFSFLKKATWLNLERNQQMDGLDWKLLEKISKKHPSVLENNNQITFTSEKPLWEET
jgi:hypothetical protein